MNHVTVFLKEPEERGFFIPTRQRGEEWVEGVYERKFFPRKTLKDKLKGWLCDKCFNILWKLKGLRTYHRITQDVGVERIDLNLDNLDEAIYQCKNAMMEIHRKKPRMIIVGRRQMRLLETPPRPISTVIPFGCESHIKVEGRNLQYEGVELCVVPWFDGIVVVPDKD